MSVTLSLIHTLKLDQASTKRHLVKFTGWALKGHYRITRVRYTYNSRYVGPGGRGTRRSRHAVWVNGMVDNLCLR